ncbi:ester cyclase [Negadavirga shengliensis]|uniref:Ester cyclase n=1 Tax=Negadavirga shengliensis TaxID=1389218 RepID=A0ABV9T259_9BACT
MEKNDFIEKVTKAINEHDAGTFASLFAEGATAHDPFYPDPLKGRKEIEKDMEIFFTAFPDLRGEVINVLASGSWIAAEFEMTGTNDGQLDSPAGALPATGKKVKFEVASFVKLDENGLVVENRRYYNVAAILQQLGIQSESV